MTQCLGFAVRVWAPGGRPALPIAWGRRRKCTVILQWQMPNLAVSRRNMTGTWLSAWAGVLAPEDKRTA